MNGLIKNNKELLIIFFCIWIGTTFTLMTIKLYDINKNLYSINDNTLEIRFMGGDINFHLKDISNELNTLSKQSGANALFREFNR